jgi:hypothetical protein
MFIPRIEVMLACPLDPSHIEQNSPQATITTKQQIE